MRRSLPAIRYLIATIFRLPERFPGTSRGRRKVALFWLAVSCSDQQLLIAIRKGDGHADEIAIDYPMMAFCAAAISLSRL